MDNKTIKISKDKNNQNTSIIAQSKLEKNYEKKTIDSNIGISIKLKLIFINHFKN